MTLTFDDHDPVTSKDTASRHKVHTTKFQLSEVWL